MNAVSQYNCTVLLPIDLPGLNEILAAKGNIYRQSGGRQRSAYTAMKKKYTGVVAKALVEQGCVPNAPYNMIEPSLIFYEPHKRRDLDNISAGGSKFVFDAMVTVGIISNDNLMHIQKMSAAYAPSETKERYVAVSWKIIE